MTAVDGRKGILQAGNNPFYGRKSLILSCSKEWVGWGVQSVTVEPQQSRGSAWKLHYSTPLDAAMMEASSGSGDLETAVSGGRLTW